MLVVDDQPANLLALQALLSADENLLVIAVGSGREALVECAQRRFAVVLLDIMMPDMDGFETLRRLRAQPGSHACTPVIFLTALTPDIATLRRAYSLGAVDFVSKPVESEILLAKMRAFVALFEQAEEIQRQSEALRVKDRHIAVLAHDLRTPLANLSMVASRLHKLNNPDVALLAQRADRAIQRMERLTHDVLELARAAALTIEPTRVSMNLAALCAQLLDEFADANPSVTFERALANEATGAWDPPRLQQAVSNLLQNAVKYGRGTVWCSVEASEQWVDLTVANECVTISSQRLDTLFEAFERDDPAGRGVGLGLFIVREIAQAHGGEVKVSSDPQRTTFCLRLPRSIPQQGRPDGQASRC